MRTFPPRIHALAIACLAATLTCTAQNPPVPENQPTPWNGRITGTVYLRDTGKPARGARVVISHPTTQDQHDGVQATATTDAEGRFLFTRLRPGGYMVAAQLNGYLMETISSARQPPIPQQPSIAVDWITLRPNETATVDITFRRSASLSGQVLYDDGTPAMNTALRVERLKTLEQRKLEAQFKAQRPEPDQPYSPLDEVITRPGDRGRTDDRGLFRITTLPAGTYRIAAIPNLQSPDDVPELGNNDQLLRSEANAPAVFSGGTLHRTNARTYELQDGDETTGIQITIPLTLMHKVSGAITALDGRTLNTGTAILTDKADPELHFATSLSKDGTFTFAAVPSGTYRLSIPQAYIAGPDLTSNTYQEDDASVPTHAFAPLDITIVVKDTDTLGLHFDLSETTLPVPKPDQPTTNK